jgi:hypothetical protein
LHNQYSVLPQTGCTGSAVNQSNPICEEGNGTEQESGIATPRERRGPLVAAEAGESAVPQADGDYSIVSKRRTVPGANGIGVATFVRCKWRQPDAGQERWRERQEK